MAADANMREVSLYSTIYWQALFQALDRALNAQPVKYTYMEDGKEKTGLALQDPEGKKFNTYIHSEDGKNVIDCAKTLQGELTQRGVEDAVSEVITVSPARFEDIRQVLEDNGISFIALNTVRDAKELPAEELANPFNKGIDDGFAIVVDVRDRDRAHLVLDDFMRETSKEVKMEELSKLCEDNQWSVKGINHIEPDVYQRMIEHNDLNFKHTVIKHVNDDLNKVTSVDLMFPSANDAEVQRSIIAAALFCSAQNRRWLETQRERLNDSRNAAGEKLLDTRKSYMAVDKTNPYHFIKSDPEGIKEFKEVGDKLVQVEEIKRTNPHIETMVTRMMMRFAGELEVMPNTHEAEQKREDLKKDMLRHSERTMEEARSYYKERLLNPIMEASERGFTGRLLDNYIKAKAAIDHNIAIGEGESVETGDLKSDMDQNRRIALGGIPEAAQDLSDLNGESFKNHFCEEVLGTRVIEDAREKADKEAELKSTLWLDQLSKDTPEVKAAVIRECRETFREFQTMEYQTIDIDMKMVRETIEKEQNVDQVLHIEEDREE